jgi:hypothetical protein
VYKHGSASLQRSADKLKAPLEMRANVCIVRIIDGDTAVCRNTRATFVFEHIGEIIACIQHLISSIRSAFVHKGKRVQIQSAFTTRPTARAMSWRSWSAAHHRYAIIRART